MGITHIANANKKGDYCDTGVSPVDGRRSRAGRPYHEYRLGALLLKPDSEVGRIVLVLVVVLVLDLWDFGAEKRAPSLGNSSVPSL